MSLPCKCVDFVNFVKTTLSFSKAGGHIGNLPRRTYPRPHGNPHPHPSPTFCSPLEVLCLILSFPRRRESRRHYASYYQYHIPLCHPVPIVTPHPNPTPTSCSPLEVLCLILSFPRKRESRRHYASYYQYHIPLCHPVHMVTPYPHPPTSCSPLSPLSFQRKLESKGTHPRTASILRPPYRSLPRPLSRGIWEGSGLCLSPIVISTVQSLPST